MENFFIENVLPIIENGWFWTGTFVIAYLICKAIKLNKYLEKLGENGKDK